MGFWDYLHQHPGWGLGYLLVICFSSVLASSLLASGMASRKDDRKQLLESKKN